MSKEDMKKRVEARRKAGAEKLDPSQGKVMTKKEIQKKTESEISDEDLQGYLNENRFGEAKLYGRLFRGKVVYVPQWDKHFVWARHYWHEAFCIWYSIYRDKRYSISPKKFAELLNKKNIPYKRSNGSWRLGIRLNEDGRKEISATRSIL